MQKKKNRRGGGQVRPGMGEARGMGDGRGGGDWLVAMLGLGGDVGYGGCEPRIEGFVQCTKRYCTIVRKLNKCGGGRGRGNIGTQNTVDVFKNKRKKVNKEKK